MFNMLTKDSLRKEFSKNWKKHYMVEIFKEKGFIRKQCKICGDFFWTLDPEKETCGDSSCEPYGFIGNPITKRKWNYIDMWKTFEKFFVKNGHKSIKRYPVIDRVRPDLFFTIASIQDFQRIENGNMVFVYPANPLIVPQMCLRFNDIDSVGISGRHLTCFMMPGQHAFGYPREGYFKDECMRLDFEFLTKVMGIPEKEITYKEDIWAMPDFSAFGPCIESFSRGLELVNHVFMQFQKSGDSYKKLDLLVNDTGWGHERLVWFSNGTYTMYDCIFGDVVDYLKKMLGVKPSELFIKYSRLAGGLDIGEIKSVRKVRERIAKELGTDVDTLKHEIEPMQAIYAIADHTRTLLFAITDGGIPSNVGGGYNLRVILRRVFSFMKEYNMDFDIMEIMEKHANYLYPLFPELKEGLRHVQEIVRIEKERYEKTLEGAKRIITKLISKKEKLDEKTLVRLYESNGITPDMVREITGMEIPDEIYSQITKKHISKKSIVKKQIEIKNVAPTKKLFYEKPEKREFDAKVVWVDKNKVVLDKTLFYPESGGQDSDKGTINRFPVRNVQKIGDVIIHVLKHKFKKGQLVHGIIDWERRKQLNQHHTAVHIINGASRSILGDHIWQAGANKTTEKATLDITHYKSLSIEEMHKIEDLANKIVKKGIKLNKVFLPRKEAEEKYGLRIYQGGVVPEKQIRIIEIPGVDVEACSGIHVNNTKEVETIVIIGVERIQDGVNRIVLKAGSAAREYLDNILKTSKYILGLFKEAPFVKITSELERRMKNPRNALRELRTASKVFDVPIEQMEITVKKFLEQIIEDKNMLNILEAKANMEKSEFKVEEMDNLKDACEYIFELWKSQRKKMEKISAKAAEMEAKKLLQKVKNNRIFEIISGTKKDLIKTASCLLSLNPNLTVVLANQSGEIIVMSKTEDANEIVKDICKKAGGAGGGKEDFAQGKAELSKLMRIIPDYK